MTRTKRREKKEGMEQREERKERSRRRGGKSEEGTGIEEKKGSGSLVTLAFYLIL